MLWETLKLAVHSVRRNVLRSVLTLLGVVIGVAAVIAMVTIGNGTTAKVTSDISKLGTNLLVLRPGQAGFGRPSGGAQARPFTERDVTALRQELRDVLAVAPVASRSTTAVYGSQNWVTSVTGTDNEYFVTQDWPLIAGRLFSESEIRSGRAACVVGTTVRDRLFGGEPPIGRLIRLKKLSCEVIGVLSSKGQSSFGQDRDDTVLVPLRAFERRIAGKPDLSNIFVSARDGVETSTVQTSIEELMRERRRIAPGSEDDFYVRDMREVVDTMTATTNVLTALLGAVAAVSLLVGGIGIMNIMLVSVTERTREIGIRLAIGALERQVLTQFLVEAVVLSIAGGLIGILLGLAIAAGTAYGMSIPFVPDPKIVVLAFVFSALVGMGFGYFPARRAARLDPIEALRHE